MHYQLKEFSVDVGINVIELPESSQIVSFGNNGDSLSVVVTYDPDDRDLHNRHLFITPLDADYLAEGFDFVGGTHISRNGQLEVVHCHQRNFRPMRRDPIRPHRNEAFSEEFSRMH